MADVLQLLLLLLCQVALQWISPGNLEDFFALRLIGPMRGKYGQPQDLNRDYRGTVISIPKGSFQCSGCRRQEL